MAYFIIFLAVNLFFLRRIENGFLGPSSMFTSVWMFTCLIYMTGIINYDAPTVELFAVLFSSFGFFYIGYYITYFLEPSRSIAFHAHKKLLRDESKSIELVFYFLFGLLAIRTISVAFGLYFRFGGVAAIFANGDLIYELTRKGLWSPGIPVVLPVEMLSGFFTSYRYLKTGRFDKLSWLTIFFIILVTTLLQSRYMLIMSFMALVSPIVGSLPKLRLLNIRRLLILIAIIVSITMSRALTSRVYGGGDGFGSLAYAGELASVVYYLSCGVAGLNEYIQIGVDEFSGSYTLNGLASVIELVTFQEGLSMRFEEVEYLTPTPTIIASAFKFIIDDFGVFSPFVFGLLGVSVRFFYRSCRNDKSRLKLLIFSALYMTLGISFFSWTFFIAGFWLYIISGTFLIFLTRTNFLRLIIK